jgi:hypothetical protein
LGGIWAIGSLMSALALTEALPRNDPPPPATQAEESEAAAMMAASAERVMFGSFVD